MKLKVQQRNVVGKKIRALRNADQVPAIVYAKHIDSPILINFRRQDFVKLYRQAGRSTPITLNGDGIDEMVLVQEIQIDPVTNFVLHVDFLGIKKGEKVTTEVPIIIEGVAPVTTSGDARIQHIKDSTHIEATPANLPHELVINVSGMEDMGDVLFLKDIVLPSGVELKDDPNLAVVSIAEVKDIPEEDDDALTLDAIQAEGEGEGSAGEGDDSESGDSEGGETE